MKATPLHGLPVADGAHPLICIPLIGRTRDAILAELAIVLPKKPDLIEWRVDFFTAIGDTALVIAVAAQIKEAAGTTPIIFTCRSLNDGGERIALDDTDVMKLYVAACASRCVDLIDYELGRPREYLARLRNASRDNDVAMIMSYQSFEATPDPDLLSAKFLDAERLGADIAKVAVMADSPEDVLTLLDATAHAGTRCVIPLIAVSLGDSSSLSRLVVWVYGSPVTVASGKQRFVPDPLSIEDLRGALAALHGVYPAPTAPLIPISSPAPG